MLELKNVQIEFTESVIENGSLLIPDGQLTALTGPSGSGKTTLLYCVGLVSSCKDYEYIFDGKQIDLSSEEETCTAVKTYHRFNDMSICFRTYVLSVGYKVRN